MKTFVNGLGSGALFTALLLAAMNPEAAFVNATVGGILLFYSRGME